jgi:hypothetical protein
MTERIYRKLSPYALLVVWFLDGARYPSLQVGPPFDGLEHCE